MQATPLTSRIQRLDSGKALLIEFANGQRFSLPAELLRVNSPSPKGGTGRAGAAAKESFMQQLFWATPPFFYFLAPISHLSTLPFSPPFLPLAVYFSLARASSPLSTFPSLSRLSKFPCLHMVFIPGSASTPPYILYLLSSPYPHRFAFSS
ncbi:hypothetical protein CLOM_g3558 [Closterium sp. NIES-68]|nr:hypothetical protein CLOM_g3558 [Closterium sp. NIES-68]GJP62220.1 hypothetical protein CLOP_g19308 [Closterium sp. NIES-67]GJP69837.1 hypothetical protein CLOP_g847 [Closterium sp. NIES-67]